MTEPDPDVAETLGLDARRSPTRIAFIIFAVICAVAMIAGGILALRGPDEKWEWETAPVIKDDLVVQITAVGTLEPLHSFEVSSDVSGRMKTVLVETNDKVAKGQVLAALDTELLDAQLRQARAQYSSALASLKQARLSVASAQKEVARSETLYAKKVVSESALDQAQDALEQAQSGVELAQAQLSQARAGVDLATTNVEHSVVVSPIDGIVLERNIDPGQAVVTSLQAQTLFRVAEDLAHMSVDVEVDEADVGVVKEGQSGTFTVAAFPDRVFDAVVHKVELAPRPGGQVVTYIACLHLDNPEGLLRPGMTATAKIATQTFEDRLLLPTSGLRFEHPDQDLLLPEAREGRKVSRVWRLSGGEPRPIEVIASVSDGRHALIEEGELKAGDAIVIRANERSK